MKLSINIQTKHWINHKRNVDWLKKCNISIRCERKSQHESHCNGMKVFAMKCLPFMFISMKSIIIWAVKPCLTSQSMWQTTFNTDSCPNVLWWMAAGLHHQPLDGAFQSAVLWPKTFRKLNFLEIHLYYNLITFFTGLALEESRWKL